MIVQAKGVPYNLVPGETRHIPGGAAPETTISGGDAGQAEAQKAGLLSTQKDADSRAALAEAATNTQTDLIQAKKLYNSLVGATDAKSVIGDGMINWLASKTPFTVQQLNDPAMARLAIKQMLKTSIGSSLAAVQGDPNAGPIRGILQQTNDSMPDPDTDERHAVQRRDRPDVESHVTTDDVWRPRSHVQAFRAIESRR